MRRAIWAILLLAGLAPARAAHAQGARLCGGLALVCARPRLAAPAQPPQPLAGLASVRRRGADLPPVRWALDEHDALRGRPGPPARGEARSVTLFRQGFELERQGKVDEAKALYFELVQQFPTSAQAALAYVAFGERFLEASGDDPGQLALARLCFERALAYPDMAAGPQLYAQFMLGRTLWAQGDAVGARQRFTAVARQGRGLSEALALAAVGALPAAWAANGSAAGLEAEARELSPGGARALLEAAAEAFLDRGKPADARRLYEALGQGASDERNCLYEARLLEVDRSENRLPRAAVVPRVLEQLRRLEAQGGGGACAAATLEAGATLATTLHQQAIAGDREAGRLAGELYEALAEQGRSGLRFARLPEALWPTPERLRFAQGSLAWSQGSWEACARAFGAVGSPEAGLYAGRCQARRVEASTPPLAVRGEFGPEGREAPPRPLQPQEQEALDALDQAACLGDDEGALRAAAARLLLEAGRLGEAAAELRAAAERAQPADRAEAAALFLEVAGRAAARDDDCADEAEAVRQAAWREACAGRNGRPGCAQLERLDSAIALVRAARLRRRAERGGLDAAELHEQAGRLLYDAARRCAIDPIERREPPTCDRPHELLWGAAEAFATARLPLKSIRVRLLLREPRFRMHRTDQARKSLVAIARSYEALADYEGAVSFYENFATEYPADPEAAPALERAVTLRLALDQEPEAARGAEVLRSPPHRAHAARAAAASLAIVQHHARRGAWADASRRLDEAWPFLQEHGSAPQRLVAQALRARLRLRQGQAAGADYHKVLDLWARSGKPDDEPSLEAVGEARTHALLSPRPTPPAPVLRGPTTVESLRRHLAGPLTVWLTQRRQGLTALDQAVEAIADHQPPLPPRWIALARVRAFDAWASLSRDAEPPRWTGGAPFAPLARPLAELLDPLRDRTTSAAWACVRSAIQASSFDEGTASCERWLQRHDGYHPLDDSLIPRPGLIGTPPSERSSPLPPPRAEP